MRASAEFPRLTPDNHRETSPADVGYNCIAWATGDVTNWWQPGIYWRPLDWPRDDCGIGALVQAFRLLGYEECETEELEPGFLKVAFYGSAFEYKHAARQLPDGKWTSKLGKQIDIEHETPSVVAGGVYGQVVQFMKVCNPGNTG